MFFILCNGKSKIFLQRECGLIYEIAKMLLLTLLIDVLVIQSLVYMNKIELAYKNLHLYGMVSHQFVLRYIILL